MTSCVLSLINGDDGIHTSCVLCGIADDGIYTSCVLCGIDDDGIHTSCVLCGIDDDGIHTSCVLCGIDGDGDSRQSLLGDALRFGMASQGARADPVVGREESGESAEGSVAPASAGGVDIGREGVGVDAPNPPGGAPAVGLPPEFAQILQMALQAQAQAQAQFLAQTHVPIPAPAPAVATIDRNYERIRRMGATEFEGTLDPEIAERWWEKVEDVLNLVDCTLENRLKYVASLFVGNALIWWRSVKRAYEPKEITWAEFQREFDDKYRPKMYRDKKKWNF
ncbi:UNVERIFIED_CONTAM: hypothetical protein Sradi_3151400 [Sesamum radiatum]|uniref:Retrotransposon gag domain-containing protein n=1 Tax=Sesamum radiatum TaxID=300843 RepID=A0AAW2REI6_SESRA